MKLQRIVICLLAITLWLRAQAIIAQDEQLPYKPDEALAAAVRKSKVVKPEYPLHVLKRGIDVLVTTLATPHEPDKNCKIDAVLVAKAIMDKDKTVLRVHYRFKDHMADQGYRAVVVKQSDVKAYGASAIDVNSLLAQLPILKRDGKRAKSE
jgi:hypothetical protein